MGENAKALRILFKAILAKLTRAAIGRKDRIRV